VSGKTECDMKRKQVSKEFTTSTRASLFGISSSSDALLTGAPVLRA